MPLALIAHGGSPVNARTSSGRLRGVAGKLGHGRCISTGAPALPVVDVAAPGRVTSAGSWTSAAVTAALSEVLGDELAPALRPTFEWYVACGAFFHNDAHYEDVLFGVWCIAGPPAELVFPRARVRLDASPSTVAVFDPFEVHGVLRPGQMTYTPGDYADAQPSVFVGFELSLTGPVAEHFAVAAASDGAVISSQTRIDAATGALA
jgi:hypothetical protein